MAPEQPIKEPAAEEQPAVEPALPPAIPPTKPAEAEHDEASAEDRGDGTNDGLFWGDGLAQWIMAIVGIAAFFLSAWAVWLLKRTLEESRKAVKAADDAVTVTRELGEAQIRAYLHCKSAKYKRTKDSVTAVLELENTGQSPASRVSISGTTTIHEVGGRPSHTRVLAWVDSSKSVMPCQPINAGGTSLAEITFFWELDFPLEAEADPVIKKSIFDDGNEIWFDLVVKWSDVFGKWQEFSVDLSAEINATPYHPKRKRSPAGVLELRMADARPGVRDADDSQSGID